MTASEIDLLTVRGLSKRFRGVQALSDVSFTLRAGEIVGLIGPNGAGKTTLVNLITGAQPPSAGTIHFGAERIDGLRVDTLARRGIARTFQVVQPFPAMTVLENVSAAALFGGRVTSVEEARLAAERELLFCGLSDQAEKLASALTLAGRKRLELAKSLALRPRLLLLDEVNAGLNPAEIDGALRLIRAIAGRGITILLIEHLMKVVTHSAARLLVLQSGRLIADGPTEAVMSDHGVIEAYLGRRYARAIGASLP